MPMILVVEDHAPFRRLICAALQRREALRLGAHGYIHKLRAASDLMPAIEAALASVPAPRRHELLLCSDDGAMVDGMTRFIAAALSAGDACVSSAERQGRSGVRAPLRSAHRGICQVEG